MNKLQHEQLDQEEKIEEALFTANRATRKVEDLAEDLKKHSRKIEKLEEQIERNKLETKQAKAEAERANERIDNLLKTQQLLDNSKEQQTLDKIQKTLELKADEAKLLADLEIISKTQKLITKPAEREWRVGIKEGKEKDIPRLEGMPLNLIHGEPKLLLRNN
jgi:outer membrane murein-binding lipoprotein Lpp